LVSSKGVVTDVRRFQFRDSSLPTVVLPRRALLVVICFILMIPAVAPAQPVHVAGINGPIGPATVSYVNRSIEQAQQQNATCLIIELDTPGGLLDSTKQIVQAMLASPVPTVVYVSPQGATATSAGCFISLAADIAAMAPATTIGAAHPVEMGGTSTPQQAQDASDPMRQKLENYAVSYIESLAARRNRNIEWARSAVKDSASISNTKAMELHVIEIIATDRQDLLRQLDGRSVVGRLLNTSGASIVPVTQTARERVFQMIWHPEVMFLLMLIAMYGIIGELSNPGAILPGVVGLIALVLMLYLASILPVNVAGFALVALAVALFVIDVFAPTHGVLTAGAIISFFLGSLMMFDRTEPMLRLSMSLIIPATVVTAAFFIFVVGAGLRAQRRPRALGLQTLVGQTVPVIHSIDGRSGTVFVEGEYWSAVSDAPIEIRQSARIVSVEGMTLHVRPVQTKGA
jgi:membrane-bound serine protease (ClpP class)